MATVGVLSLQGDVSEHLDLIKSLGAQAASVKHPYELEVVDGLIIPGGESTTVGLLLKETGLDAAIEKRVREGMPVWGTCMGMILVAKKLIDNPVDQLTLGLLDITVRRNAFGRQQESFEDEIQVAGLKDKKPFPAVFIRAPWIEAAGPGVEILAVYQGKPVLVRERAIMASAFHPEIAKDARIHQVFLGMMRERGLSN